MYVFLYHASVYDFLNQCNLYYYKVLTWLCMFVRPEWTTKLLDQAKCHLEQSCFMFMGRFWITLIFIGGFINYIGLIGVNWFRYAKETLNFDLSPVSASVYQESMVDYRSKVCRKTVASLKTWRYLRLTRSLFTEHLQGRGLIYTKTDYIFGLSMVKLSQDASRFRFNQYLKVFCFCCFLCL